MSTKLNKLSPSQTELIIELNQEEFKPYLIKAAQTISQAADIHGFRPGHAPYEAIVRQFGEMRIYETAAEQAVPQTLTKALLENKIEMVGDPEIVIEKLAPGNPLIFKAKVSLMPLVKLPAWQKLKFKRNPFTASSNEIEKALADIQKGRAKEILVERPAGPGDKVMIDLDIMRDKVPVEGGQAKSHAVYLNENHYIPGFPEQLIGLKAGEIKEFSLDFPEKHYQKHLAGKKADFKVSVKAVYERQLAPLDDDFAKTVGQKTVAELRGVIENNLKLEAGQKEESRLEREIMEALVKEAVIGELPEVLLAVEKRKMLAELKEGLASMSLEWEKYLAELKKTEKDIVDGFKNGAEERVKASLILRQLAREEKVGCSDEELEQEKARARELYKDNAQIEERLLDPVIQNYLATTLINRKIMQMLKEKLVYE